MGFSTYNCLIKIVGIAKCRCGQNGADHDVCGSILTLDSLVRFQLMVITNDHGNPKTALRVKIVSNSQDCCLVGFLQFDCVVRNNNYKDKLVQIINLHSLLLDKSVCTRSHAMR